MKLIKFTTMALLITFISLSYSTAQGFTNLSECLVTNDIGIFAYDSEYSRLGNACGVVGGADHFKVDHVDSICNGSYSKNVDVSGLSKKERFKILLNVDVQVTQHAGGDSDRWLLHEVDADFRNYYGIPGQAYGQRKINGQPILEAGYRIYRWLSGNKVINIQYTADDQIKPEPLEVVQAYLVKHPSTITSITLKQLRSDENVIKWIKDEMDRRLWLCDKWNAQSAGGVTQANLITKLLEHMDVFLKYREKYFKISAEDESNLLDTYQVSNNLTAIQTKLTEYKTWWVKHKDKSISLKQIR